MLNIIFAKEIFTSDVWAYIDPGIGSYIFQITIAFLIGTGYAIVSSWRKIFSFFSGIISRKKTKQ